MLTRILTALIGVVVFFVALALPAQCFPYIIFAVTVIMLFEMYGVLKCGKLVNTVGYLSAVAVFAARNLTNNSWELFLSLIIIAYLISVITAHGQKSAKDILAHGFITLYLTLSMCYISRTYMEFSGFAVMWIFIVAWMTDTGAYFAGVFLGKHKLCPSISPKKTVEGAVGGVLTSGLSCLVYYLILLSIGAVGDGFRITTALCFLALGIFASGLSQLGDLAASCIKRDSGVKDYGSIMPGHGGFMDRFDSVVFVAPFVYYSLTIIFWTYVI